MKSLKNTCAMLALLSYAPTALLGNSYEQRIKDFYPVDNSDRADIPNIVKQEIYKLNGLQEGFRLIGENFEKFVDTSITSIMSKNKNADLDPVNFLNALNQRIEDKIIHKITPMFVRELKTAIENKEDLAIDQPQEFSKKHPVLKYALDYTDSFTGQIFKDMREPSGRIAKPVMNAPGMYDPNPRHRFGYFIAAVDNQNISVIKFLLAGGVDVNARNDNRDTALHLAAKMNEDKVAQILIDNGANIKARNRSGSIPLHDAARYDSCNIAQLLINNGADVNAKNHNGYTPLDIAAMENSYEIAPLLITNGADVTAKVIPLLQFFILHQQKPSATLSKPLLYIISI